MLNLPDGNGAVGQIAVEAEKGKYEPKHDVQHIIGGRPLEKLFGKEVGAARDELVEIDRAENKIKDDRGPFQPRKHDQKADHAKNNVKDIIGRGIAGRGKFG